MTEVLQAAIMQMSSDFATPFPMQNSFPSAKELDLKKAAKTSYENTLKEYLNPWVISGYFLLAASTICVIFAFKGVDFKNGPVIESLGFPLVMILGRIFFGEKLTSNKIIGMGLIMAGKIVRDLAGVDAE